MPIFRQKMNEELPLETRVDRSTHELELDVIGRRLTAVKKTLTSLGRSKRTAWARKYWKEVERQLLKKWNFTLYKIDSGLVEVRSHKYRPYEIDYNFWEGSEELDVTLSVPVINRLFEPRDLHIRLNESWERAREESLKKARQGLL